MSVAGVMLLVPGHWPLVVTTEAGPEAELQLTAVWAGVIIPLQSRLQTAECLVCRPRPELHRWPGAGVTKRPPFRYSLQPGLDIITLAQTRLPASTFHETF